MLRLPRNLRFEVDKVLHLPRNLHFEVHNLLCLPGNLHFEIFTSRKVLRLPRNLHFQVHIVLPLLRNLHFEVHKSAVPATKCALRSKAAPIPCTCHEKPTLDHQSTRTKSDHHVRKCARHHNKSATATSTRRGHPDFASVRSRNALGGFREA